MQKINDDIREKQNTQIKKKTPPQKIPLEWYTDHYSESPQQGSDGNRKCMYQVSRRDIILEYAWSLLHVEEKINGPYKRGEGHINVLNKNISNAYPIWNTLQKRKTQYET